MKIAWVGWQGPFMDEQSNGLEKLDPDMMFYVVGINDTLDHKPTKNRVIFTDKDELFSALEKVDVVIYDTFIFSVGDDCNVEPLIYGNGCITQFEEWANLKAKKILYDGESNAGKDEWYKENIYHFDHIVTTNPSMPGFHTPYLVNPDNYCNWGSNNHIKVFYSGSHLDTGYRKEIADLLRTDRRNVVLSYIMPDNGWQVLLNQSKMYLATYSCASGHLYPMGMKLKEMRALLCGALPLTEEFPLMDKYLEPGIERVVFKNFDDMMEKIEYYDTHEEERRAIVEAGKYKILTHLKQEDMWRNAFIQFGIIKGDEHG